MSLHAAIHKVIGYVQNQHPINVLNAICLNSFRIKSAQSRREQNWVEWPIYSAHRAVTFAIARHLVFLLR